MQAYIKETDGSDTVIGRRQFIAGSVVMITLPVLAQRQLVKGYRWMSADVEALNQALAELERTSQGRLGVSLLDTGSGQVVSYRGAKA